MAAGVGATGGEASGPAVPSATVTMSTTAELGSGVSITGFREAGHLLERRCLQVTGFDEPAILAEVRDAAPGVVGRHDEPWAVGEPLLAGV